MPIHPQIEPMLAALAPLTSLDWSTVDVATARAFAGDPLPPPFEVAMAAIHDIHVGSGDHAFGARLYRPVLDEGLPAIAFFHGGGWVSGTIGTYDFLCRLLARETGCAVLSVDYRLAPEHPYPAAIEDCYAAVQWLARQAASFGIDGARLAVAGDSAGGNLAAAAAILSRDRGGAALRHQMLFYPVADRDFDTPSYRDNDGYLLTRGMMMWYWRHYVGDRLAAEVPLAVLCGFDDLSGLPPATILTAEYDPLRDEGELYARKLAQAGVPAELARVPGMIHGFISMVGMVDPAEHWLRHAAMRLRSALTAPDAA